MALTVLALALGGCAGQPTVPDPSVLAVPTKHIVVTEGGLTTPHQVLGQVHAILGGLHDEDLSGASEAAKQHLRKVAYTRWGERLDAILNVKTTVVPPSSALEGWFRGPRGLRIEGVAVTFPPPLPRVLEDSTEELLFPEAADVATDAIIGQLRQQPGSRSGADAGSGKQGVVVDPILDATSGQQTAATRLLERRVAERLARTDLDVLPFRIASLGTARYLLTGTMTRLDGPSQRPRSTFQINLALVDVKTGTVVARASSRARDDGVDTNPTPYYRDSPILVKDQVVDGYIRTAQTKSSGSPADPLYFERVTTATLIGEALAAYNAERYHDALALYRDAAATPAGEQLRVLNGVYLATWKLGRAREAEDAFGTIVTFGLRNNNLGLKFLFNPGTTEFWPDPKISGPYGLWLRQIALQAAAAKACMEVVGHTSRTGSEQYNERLSRQRAVHIKQLLEREAPELGPRLRVSGVGFRENLIGSGTDDARDALDRRVEFKVTGC